ncbi:MAG TPA: hypothetical protein VMT46_06655 [Anaerolineaceae bacterium]|nr:hypothetical protein [Anaerolineaceae bacterium]
MDNPSIHPPDQDQPSRSEDLASENMPVSPAENSAAETANHGAPPVEPFQETAGEPAPAAPAKKPRSGVLNFFFNPDTRFGRFNRATLRVVATVVGLFALGLLSAYLLLYRPAQQELQQTKADLARANQRLDSLQTDLDQARLAQENSNRSSQELSGQTEMANNHVLLLQAMNKANLARLALAKNDPAGAEQALKDAPAILLKLNPAISAENGDLAKSIQTRLNLALNEIRSDPRTATSDLGILNDQFLDLEKKITAGP